jgi:hypothetical protein
LQGGEKERGMEAWKATRSYMGGTDTGEDKRGESNNFAAESVCKCLYMLDTHNVRAVFN